MESIRVVRVKVDVCVVRVVSIRGQRLCPVRCFLFMIARGPAGLHLLCGILMAFLLPDRVCCHVNVCSVG